MMAAIRNDLARRQDMIFGPPPTAEEIAFTNAPHILAQVSTFFAVASIVVLLRVYVRLRMVKVFGIDDYIMLVALGFVTAVYTCFHLRAQHGLGKYQTVLFMTPLELIKMTEILYVQGIIVVVGLSIIKISIAFSLLRLAIQRVYTRILKASIAFIIVMTIFCVGTLMFQCLPINAAWDVRLRPPPLGTGTARCYSLGLFLGFGLFNSCFHIVTDVLFATLPIPLIWQLQLNTRVKMSLVLILSLGWFACAAGIIKAYKQYHVFEDLNWTVDDSFNVWAFIEMTVGIIAGSLPTLKPLLHRFFETVTAITSGGRTKLATLRKSGSQGTGKHGNVEKLRLTSSMRNLRGTGNSSPNSSISPYRVECSTQPLDRVDERVDEESGARLQPPGIVRTREVSVS